MMHSRRINSLGKYTVNNLPSFFYDFCRFWQGRLHFQSFHQNILNSLFRIFMYTLFLLKNKSSRKNHGFRVENDVENVRWMRGKRPIQAHSACITMFSTSFSTVNPRFLQEDLFSSKKSVYMKNAEERARCKIFWRKLWKWSIPCQNLQKPPQNCANYLLCGSLRKWSIVTDENMFLN